MAKLALTLSKEKFDELDETLKEFYTTTKDGGYELDGVGSLKRAIEAEKAEKQNAIDKAIAEALKPYEGVDLEAAKKAIADQRKAADEKLKEEGNFDKYKEEYERRINELDAKRAQEVEAERTEKNSILANLKRERLANVLTEKGVLSDRVKYLVGELDSTIELVSGESGFSLKKIGGIGDDTEFNAIIEDVKTKSPFFFASDNIPGSGASGSNGNGGNGKTITRKQYEANPLQYAKQLATRELTLTD